MRVPEFINRRLPCPNEWDIRSKNYIGELRMQTWQSQLAGDQKDAELKILFDGLSEVKGVLGEIQLDSDGTDGLFELDEARRQVDEGLMELQVGQRLIEAMGRGLTRMENPIDNIVAEAGKITCQRCTGVVVDLKTGRIYCGREVPEEVLESNKLV